MLGCWARWELGSVLCMYGPSWYNIICYSIYVLISCVYYVCMIQCVLLITLCDPWDYNIGSVSGSTYLRWIQADDIRTRD